MHQHTISTPSPFFAITHQTSQAFSFALQAVRDSFWGGEKPSPTSGPGVSLDRGETHVEEARSLGLEHAPLYGGEHLLAEGSGPERCRLVSFWDTSDPYRTVSGRHSEKFTAKNRHSLSM